METNKLVKLSDVKELIEKAIHLRKSNMVVNQKSHSDIQHNADMRYEINIINEILSSLSSLPTQAPIGEWISVEDKTPNTDVPIFTYCNGVPTIALKTYSGEWVEAYDYESLGNNVKLWTPLPLPPTN